jgi:hypothetical protein
MGTHCGKEPASYGRVLGTAQVDLITAQELGLHPCVFGLGQTFKAQGILSMFDII